MQVARLAQELYLLGVVAAGDLRSDVVEGALGVLRDAVADLVVVRLEGTLLGQQPLTRCLALRFGALACACFLLLCCEWDGGLLTTGWDRSTVTGRLLWPPRPCTIRR